MIKKINYLLNNTAFGEIVLQSWLSRYGITPQLARKYNQSQWLVKLGAGVYYRSGAEPKWQNALHCLQSQNMLAVHLAGLTSLSYQGKAHYLQLTTGSIWINVYGKNILPQWFKTFPKLSAAERWEIIRTPKLTIIEEHDLMTIEVGGTTLKTSNPELAAFEVLEAVSSVISFEHAADIFQNLVNLSPKKVESILRRSHSIKTNRLFLFLGHFYKHPWIERIDESIINLGKGKRQLVLNGKLEKRYQITVPAQYTSND